MKTWPKRLHTRGVVNDSADLLEELKTLMVRTVAIMDGMETMEHRVGTVIEGGRQQLSHVVADLHLPEMRAELRAIKAALEKIGRQLK